MNEPTKPTNGEPTRRVFDPEHPYGKDRDKNGRALDRELRLIEAIEGIKRDVTTISRTMEDFKHKFCAAFNVNSSSGDNRTISKPITSEDARTALRVKYGGSFRPPSEKTFRAHCARLEFDPQKLYQRMIPKIQASLDNAKAHTAKRARRTQFKKSKKFI